MRRDSGKVYRDAKCREYPGLLVQVKIIPFIVSPIAPYL